MQCPHCAAELRYRERRNNRCSKCRQGFALEPKTAPLRMSDVRMQRLAARLSDNGRLRYTTDQLLYSASRSKTKHGVGHVVSQVLGRLFTTGFLAVGVTIFGVFAVSILPPALASLATAVAIGFVVLVVAVLLGLVWRDFAKTFYPDLPTTSEQFQRDVIWPWQRFYGSLPLGLLDDQARQSLQRRQPPPTQVRAVVACPESAIRDCLHANNQPLTIGIGVVPTTAPFSPQEQIMIDLLRRQPATPLLVLHDASPAGAVLAQTVVPALGLSATQRVIDLGLRPQTVIANTLMQLRTRPPRELIVLLRKHKALAPAELAWLEKGYHSSILAIAPPRLLAVIADGVYRSEQRRITATAPRLDPEQQAQHEAQQVGFMSWPE